MDDFIFIPILPSPQDFKKLRDSAAWGEISIKQAQASLLSSIGGMSALHSDTTVGMARVVGDGVLNIYVQDVVIAETYRGRGLGKHLLVKLFEWLQKHYPADCTIGLMAAKNQDDFYAQFGFIPRPSNVYGAGMIAPLGNIRLK